MARLAFALVAILTMFSTRQLYLSVYTRDQVVAIRQNARILSSTPVTMF